MNVTHNNIKPNTKEVRASHVMFHITPHSSPLLGRFAESDSKIQHTRGGGGIRKILAKGRDMMAKGERCVKRMRNSTARVIKGLKGKQGKKLHRCSMHANKCIELQSIAVIRARSKRYRYQAHLV